MNLNEVYNNSNYLIDSYLFDTIYQDLFSFETVAQIISGLESSNQVNKLNYIRFYRDGLEDYFSSEKVIQYLNNKGNGGDISERIIKAFGKDSEFGYGSGIIINGGLQWAKNVADKTFKLSKDIEKILGPINFTIDLTIFMGAYKSTPFGVHTDDNSHRTILSNLGPEKKEVIVWENEDIEREFGKVANIKNYKEIKSLGEFSTIDSGMSFVLPSRKYHIGLNEKLSTTIALVIDIVDNSKSLREEIKNITNEIEYFDERILKLNLEDLLHINYKRNKSKDMIKYSVYNFIDRDLINEKTKLLKNNTVKIEFFNKSQNSIMFVNGHLFLLKKSYFSKLMCFSYNFETNFYEAYNDFNEIFKNIEETISFIFFLIESGFYEVIE